MTWFPGKLIVRFDDTNPSKEKDEYVDNILEDLAELGVKADIITYTSDYFPQLVEVATKLIETGDMYTDDTPQEQMRQVGVYAMEDHFGGSLLVRHFWRWLRPLGSCVLHIMLLWGGTFCYWCYTLCYSLVLYIRLTPEFIFFHF